MTHPLDDEDALGEVTYHVIATHHNTKAVGVGHADNPEAALAQARDDLLNKLETVGGC